MSSIWSRASERSGVSNVLAWRSSRRSSPKPAWQAQSCCPLTTRTVSGDAFPLRVRLSKGSGGVARDSNILVDQMLAWDNALFGRELGVLPEALQDEVKRALRDFLDL